MVDYGFYIKASPMGDNAFKIGIFALKHIGSRLGTYQNAFGPTYQDRFEQVWLGTEQEVRELERLLKIKLRRKVAGATRGYTEWITDITFEELAGEVELEIHGLGLDVFRPQGYGKIFGSDTERLVKEFLVEQAK